MLLQATHLELRSARTIFGLSARRLFEHTELGQINVFSQAIGARTGVGFDVAPEFIDLIQLDGQAFSLAGFTLADLWAGRLPPDSSLHGDTALFELTRSVEGIAFVKAVAVHLERCATRQALRNQHHPFLPTAQADDAFGLPGIYSTLQRRLRAMGNARAGRDQWLKTIENFQKTGLRAEEVESSNLAQAMFAGSDDGNQYTAFALADLCNFKHRRLSVIPVVSEAQRQLNFDTSTSKKLVRTKNLPKALARLPRVVARFEPALGYRIEKVEHQTLWGPEHTWQAVTYGGYVIRNGLNHTGFQALADATALAASHARQNFPKRMALGRFNRYAWTGGETYREWLITLPRDEANYLAGHFKLRNVVAHVRSDIRQGPEGERVLVLHEVQSDWAQTARRAIRNTELAPDDVVRPPFMKEWPALAMKLVLLHASHQSLDAVAWTRGAHQVFRYDGLGAAGLIELYDRTLPREVNRMLKPYAVASETLGVYVPTNFSIRETESGYQVYSPSNDLLGTATTLEDARQFLPDLGHELLYEVHGVRLSAATRQAIRAAGFPAWG